MKTISQPEDSDALPFPETLVINSKNDLSFILRDNDLFYKNKQQVISYFDKVTTFTIKIPNSNGIKNLLNILQNNISIVELEVFDSKIGDEEAKVLATNTTITNLNLECNQIGIEGAKYLAANTTITRLNLARNQIGDEGAKHLVANTTITDLNLKRNQIEIEGAKHLAAILLLLA